MRRLAALLAAALCLGGCASFGGRDAAGAKSADAHLPQILESGACAVARPDLGLQSLARFPVDGTLLVDRADEAA